MPITTSINHIERRIDASFIGDVSGREFAEWRVALSRSIAVDEYDMIHDWTAYFGSISDADILALPIREPPTDRLTLVVSRDPYLPKWLASIAARNGHIVPGRRLLQVRSHAEALDQLRRRDSAGGESGQDAAG